MRLSFIAPRPKPFLSLFSKMWLSFIGLMSGLMLMFNFLLAAPLKSIFHTSNTTFYLTKEGWYNFVSINKIIGEDGIRE